MLPFRSMQSELCQIEYCEILDFTERQRFNLFIFLLACPSHQKNAPTTDFSLDMIPKEDESAIIFCSHASVWKKLMKVFETETSQTMAHKQWIVEHRAGERAGCFYNDDWQQEESFQLSGGHQSNNKSVCLSGGSELTEWTLSTWLNIIASWK